MKSVFISTWLSTSIKLDKLVISFLSLRWKFSFSVQIKKMGLKHLINISLIFLLKLRFDESFLKLISIKVFYYFFRRFFFILVISYIIMMADGWNISKLKNIVSASENWRVTWIFMHIFSIAWFITEKKVTKKSPWHVIFYKISQYLPVLASIFK